MEARASDEGPPSTLSDNLNRECFCVTLDRSALDAALRHEAGDLEPCARFLTDRPHLFSNTPLFVPREAIDAMLGVVRAIEASTSLEGYRRETLAWAGEIAQADFGPLGALMGYDFHLTPDGPRLIEINTNAGGAFLNALLVRAQRACCPEVARALDLHEPPALEARLVQMFRQEWARQRGGAPLSRIAIVDDAPEDQYLYPEFILARSLFHRHGIDAVIADARELRHHDRALHADGAPVDLVYNRLVDFSLDAPDHLALRRAYLEGAVVVTPNPRTHALFADKRNLVLLCDAPALRAWGLPEEHLPALAAVPRTVLVTPDSADALWSRRKELFFKPARGHASKAVYRGAKLTRRVWSEIVDAGYVAQEFAPPGERVVEVDGCREIRKADVRLYVYDGQILLAAARLYQGQTTNFRTPGGGFAPVFPV